MPKAEEKIVIASAADLQHHFDSILPNLHLTETEDSWTKIEKSLMKLESITKSGGYKYDSFPVLFKSVAEPIINSLLSERTKLSGTAADLLNSVAPRLGERFEALVNVFTPCLLLICARTNKVALFRAKKCLLLIAKHCKLPSLIPHLREASKDKSQSMRIVSVEVTMMLLEAIECRERIGKKVADLEVIIKGTATDRDPEVRQWCKRVFEVYLDRWPDRATLFTSAFTPTTRRYLALAKVGNDKVSAPIGITSTTTQSKWAPLRPTAPPAKRVDLSQLPRQRSEAISTKAATSSNHASTSYATPAAATVRVASTGRNGQARLQNPSSSRSGSGSGAEPRRTTSTPITVDVSTQQINEIDAQEEKRLASLRADLLKQATGTPSQGLAARLALEQFEFHLRKKKSSHVNSEDLFEQIDKHGPTPFNVAMAKKQSALKKGPGRIIIVPPPTIRKDSDESIKPAKRIISTAAAAAAASAPANVKSKPEKGDPDDVFRSRPIEKSQPGTPKVTSSISKNLNARKKLLGPSVSANANAVNRAKATNLRGKVAGKKAGLKVDIGKENIPPGSTLSAIAVTASQLGSRSRSPSEEVLLDYSDKKAVPVEAEKVFAEGKVAQEEGAIVETSRGEREDAVNSPFSKDNEEVDIVDVCPGPASLDAPDAPVDEAKSPLGNWSKVTESLQEDVPQSASKSSSRLRPAGPPMSTPIRKPLGALQDNKSQSSPISSRSKHTLAKVSSIVSLDLLSHVASAVEVDRSHEAEEEAVPLNMMTGHRRPLLLIPTRKM
ncbi:hypothetical protein CBS101457_003103 [Exobasidium rhododendri]|nr:hypothetical protein CBS101457_003103 [Exobasidium rhododendri]